MGLRIYSEYFNKIIRTVAIGIIILLLLSFIRSYGVWLKSSYNVFLLVDNCIVIVLALLVFFHPTWLKLLSFIGFQYSFIILFSEVVNNMGILMYFLAVVVLLLDGTYNKHRNRKIIITCLGLLILVFSQLRFGTDLFFNYLVEKLAYTFVFLLIFFFLYLFIEKKLLEKRKILNLAKYDGMRKRDVVWLQKIQKKEKYDNIAKDDGISLGSVKNRLKVIFDTLGVGDKVGFLNKYEDYEIVYDDAGAMDINLNAENTLNKQEDIDE